MTTLVAQDFTSFVFASNDEIKTTSLLVAEKFGKLHKDVLKKIQTLDCSNDFTERNFAPSEYTDPTGRKLTMYEMTKDGFMFLVMGFTGKAAAQIKEAYINAFNLMHAKLFPKQPVNDYINAPASLPKLLSEKMTAQQKIMMLILGQRADANGKCQISIGDLAPLCGIERSTTSKNLTDLVEAGFLTVTKKRYEHGGSQPNIYTIPERFRMVECELLEPVKVEYPSANEFDDLKNFHEIVRIPQGYELISTKERHELQKAARLDEPEKKVMAALSKAQDGGARENFAAFIGFMGEDQDRLNEFLDILSHATPRTA